MFFSSTSLQYRINDLLLVVILVIMKLLRFWMHVHVNATLQNWQSSKTYLMFTVKIRNETIVSKSQNFIISIIVDRWDLLQSSVHAVHGVENGEVLQKKCTLSWKKPHLPKNASLFVNIHLTWLWTINKVDKQFENLNSLLSVLSERCHRGYSTAIVTRLNSGFRNHSLE